MLHPKIAGDFCTGWLSKDPYGLKGGVNLYSFVCNSPLSLVDYLGLAPKQPFDWHHNFVQKYREQFEALGIDIDSKDNGWIFYRKDHKELTSSFEEKWDQFWAQKDRNPANTSKCEVESYFNTQIKGEFEDHYSRGGKPTVGYTKWSGQKWDKKWKLGTNAIQKTAVAAGGVLLILETKASVDWVTKSGQQEKMAQLASVMTSGDSSTRFVGVREWYQQNFPGIADPWGIPSVRAASEAMSGEPWSQEFADQFVQSFSEDSDE